MKVRIGISNTDKLIEIEVDDVKAFKTEIEEAVAGDGISWFTDSRGRAVGIPVRSVAYIEIESADDVHTVGFAPSV